MVQVTLNGVTKTFGDVVAVDNVSLTIEKGELFFLLGPSGCGKTTLLRMIAGFYTPDSGSIIFDKRDITRLPPHKRNTGMVFQNYALWPHMTAAKNVAYGLDVRKLPADEIADRTASALNAVQMGSYADRFPNQLSGGQQQRIALARALVIEPDAVLLDEPLSNLDAKLRTEMRHEIRRIHDDIGITMIYVTHDQAEALSMADRLAVMENGMVRQEGSPREVYGHPKDRFVASFIGETNMIDGHVTSADTVTEVETACGKVVASGPYSIDAGQRVICSIRPESFSFHKEGEGLGGAEFTGIVDSVVYLGATEQYTTRLEDGSLIKSTEFNPDVSRAKVGQEVRLSARSRDIVLLPMSSEDNK